MTMTMRQRPGEHLGVETFKDEAERMMKKTGVRKLFNKPEEKPPEQ